MTLDILIYAAVAILLLYRLHSVLGTQDETPGQNRKNPYRQQRNGQGPTGPSARSDAQAGESPLAKPAPMTATGPVGTLKHADASFNEQQFVKGAEMAFGMITKAFAEGDTDTLRRLLSPRLFQVFLQAIDQRETAGESQEQAVHSVESVDIHSAEVDDDLARVEVRFVSEQTQVWRNEKGAVIDGDPDQRLTVTDLWTFERRIGANDPTWLLVRTRTPEDA